MNINTSSSWNAKGGKKHKTMKVESDKFSVVPESVLYHILSFLDMKYVVQTSVLSTKWRYYWTSLQCLNFSNDTFENEDNFMHFVDELISHRGGLDVHRFHLHYNHDVLPRTLNSLVSYAVRRNVQEVRLAIYTQERFKLPNSLFNSVSLKKMKIEFKVDISYFEGYELFLPSSINLPALKTLHLKSLCFADKERTTKLFSSCPSLESLAIKGCIITPLRNMVIDAPNLKHFSINSSNDEFFLEDEDPIPTDIEINIYAPKLASFTCEDYVFVEHHLRNCSRLEKANIGLRFIEYSIDPETGVEQLANNKELYGQRVISCLGGVSHVKALKLSAELLQFVSEPPTILEQLHRNFCNLKYLKLETFMSRNHILAIIHLLKISPRLESLVLLSTWICLDAPKQQRWDGVGAIETADYPVAGLSLDCLKFFRMKNVEGNIHELMFVKIVLEAARIMEKMVLELDQERVTRRMVRLREKLLSFPRASPNVEISF